MFYNKVTVIQEQCGPECFQKRNKYMIDNSDVVVALWDEKTSKEAYNAIMQGHREKKLYAWVHCKNKRFTSPKFPV